MYYLTHPYLLIPGICTAILIGILYWGPSYHTRFFSALSPETQILSPDTNTVYATIGSKGYALETSTTNEEHRRGLSGRTNLEPYTGMLFIYNQPGLYSFWMIDMNFPIDIIWLDENKRVVYVVSNAQPDSYPDKFTPSVPAQYVVEIPSGAYTEGDTISW